ncbi:aspartate/glutamate racemase family protein [Rhodovulum sp. 12E13]|uniref:aspartate/glutamate racemase family protein n=1 Tax=Rhodovulum sp. 12E13 TaxID=2203891 RepID=UPI0018F3241C|nr:amino acid racemase [Rhodovulum sp. 12E13]
MRPVGILGGMGPEATILLQRKLIEAVPARDDADHLPLMIDMNPQVPSRIAHLIEGTGESPAPVLAAMAARLEAMGATALAMPCNTAHHYTGAIRGAARIPFLDMVALSAAACAGAEGGRIGMLASPAVRRTALFERAFAAHGLEAVWPDDEAGVLASIRAIKAGGASEAAAAGLRAASERLAEAGARVQLVACTEFSLAMHLLPGNVDARDTLDALVAAIVAHATTPAKVPQR